LCLGEQIANLVVRGGVEVAVVFADGKKGCGSFKAEKVVDFAKDGVAGIGRRHGDSGEDTERNRAQSAGCGFHGGSGSEAIVDEEDGATGAIERRTAGAPGGFAAQYFLLLLGQDCIDSGLRDGEIANDGLVENDEAAAGDCAHGQLFFAGNAKFADDKDIEL
jgi:hypothetical protein